MGRVSVVANGANEKFVRFVARPLAPSATTDYLGRSLYLIQTPHRIP